GLPGGRRHGDRGRGAGLHLGAIGRGDDLGRLVDVDALAGLAVDGDGLAGDELDGAVGVRRGAADAVEGGVQLLLVDGHDGVDGPLVAEQRADHGDRVVVALGGVPDGGVDVQLQTGVVRL